MEIQKGQVWRKLGPYDWLKVDMIRDPRYPEYDGGLIGCEVTFYPPQKKVINLRGGKRRFIFGRDWEEQVRDNRFLLEEGQPINML